ncbi:MAG TPA: hypothetical protein VFZ65_11120 [Planctomycetota bacterium]|nr:hypothetical protein [Planctomycetota bacterium]
MAPKDDIPDSLFDDDLARSIAKSDDEGEWRDNTPTFVDPKIEQIKKQLVEPPRRSYTERRLRDLQHRALTGEAGNRPAPAEPDTLPSGEPWIEPEVRPGPPTVTRTMPGIAVVRRRVVRHPFASYSLSLASGLTLFAMDSAVYSLMTGWRSDIVMRAILGGVLAGLGWRFFQVGRFRAVLVGLSAHVLVFSLSARLGDTVEQVAILCGGLVAVLGSVMLGMVRESRDEHAPLR